MASSRSGPLESPWAIKTCFGWVLAGATNGKPKSKEDICYLSTVYNKKQKRSWKSADLNQPALALKKQVVVEHIHEDRFGDASGKFIVCQLVKFDSQSALPAESRPAVVRRSKHHKSFLGEKSHFVRKSKAHEHSIGVKSCFVGFIDPLKQGCKGDKT